MSTNDGCRADKRKARAEKAGELRHKPFGLTHPTWLEPTCFFYDTAEEAAAAIVRTYGEDSAHRVVGLVVIEPKP